MLQPYLLLLRNNVVLGSETRGQESVLFSPRFQNTKNLFSKKRVSFLVFPMFPKHFFGVHVSKNYFLKQFL